MKNPICVQLQTTSDKVLHPQHRGGTYYDRETFEFTIYNRWQSGGPNFFSFDIGLRLYWIKK